MDPDGAYSKSNSELETTCHSQTYPEQIARVALAHETYMASKSVGLVVHSAYHPRVPVVEIRDLHCQAGAYIVVQLCHRRTFKTKIAVGAR